jgi:conjugal transfer ATP-binding protein TraC
MWFVAQTGFYHRDMDGTEKGLCRGITCNFYNAASLFHVQGDWRGVHPSAGGLLAICRKGELALLDNFKSDENFNAIVAAPSGSGKSFLVNEIAKSARSTGGKVFIIDIGLSYFQTCDLMGGKNIVFEKSANLCLNFCSEIHEEKDFLESKQMMVSLFASMCFATGKSGEDFDQIYHFEISVLSRAVEEVWYQLGSNMSVRDIYDWFVNAYDGKIDARYHHDRRIGDMIEYLREWAYGIYAKWFVGKCNLNFDNDYIVLELEELKFDQKLQTVVMNFIISRISHDVYLGFKEDEQEAKRKKTTLIIDEAWDALRSENTAAFMEEAARRFRKYWAAIIIASQSFSDMQRNSAGLAFAQNCNSIIALKSNVKNVEKAAEDGVIPLEKHHLRWIKSITKTHDYSEFFWINRSMNAEGLYRFIVDPVTAYIYSSTGTVRDEIQAKINKGKSREEAIVEMANSAIDLDLWASSKLDKVIYANQKDRRAFYQERLTQDQKGKKNQGVSNVG